MLPTPQAQLPPLQGAWGSQYGQQLLPHAAFNMHPGAYGAAADESSAGTGEDGSCSNGGGPGLMGPCAATAGTWYVGPRSPVADGRALPVPPAPLSALYGRVMQPSVIWGLSQHQESSSSGAAQWPLPDSAATTVRSPVWGSGCLRFYGKCTKRRHKFQEEDSLPPIPLTDLDPETMTREQRLQLKREKARVYSMRARRRQERYVTELKASVDVLMVRACVCGGVVAGAGVGVVDRPPDGVACHRDNIR